MKKYIPYIIILVVGIVIGLLCRPEHFRDATKMIQNDTIVKYEMRYYSKMDLQNKTIELDVPDIGKREYVFFTEEKTKEMYIDSIRYMAAPRQYYFTSTDDVKIWHSGIDSTIDSLNFVQKTETITKTIQEKWRRNYLSLGLEVSYTDKAYIPLYLQYSYLPNKNVEMYARVLYDIPTRLYGFGLGAKVGIGW